MSRSVCQRCGASYQGLACHLCGDTLLTHAAQDPLLGKIISGRYRIIRKLGQGGMGAVYLAEQVGIGHRVALKLLNTALAGHEEIIQRFLNEAKSYARIAHPHAVAFHEFGQDEEGRLFISTEYIEGPDLKKYLIDRGRLSVYEAVEIVLQIADALEHAHQNGVIHRDLKPENVIVRQGMRGLHAKVLDFGIARLLEDGKERLTMAGNIAGTPQYMSPEQVRGQDVDARADVYVIGVVLFELLTGLQPFAATTVPEMLYRQAHDPVPQLADFVQGLDGIDRVIQRATAKDPDARTASMAAFAAELLDAMGELPPAPPGQQSRIPTPQPGSVPAPAGGPHGTMLHGGALDASAPRATSSPAAAGAEASDATMLHGAALPAAPSASVGGAMGPGGTILHGAALPASASAGASEAMGPGGTILHGAALQAGEPTSAGGVGDGSPLHGAALEAGASAGEGEAVVVAAVTDGALLHGKASPASAASSMPFASASAAGVIAADRSGPGASRATTPAGSAAAAAGTADSRSLEASARVDSAFAWSGPPAKNSGAIEGSRKRSRGWVFAVAVVVGLSAFGAAALSRGWIGEGPAPRDSRDSTSSPTAVEATVGGAADPIQAAGVVPEDQRLRQALLAKEIWLKANAEFLSGNLGSAAEILATVPDDESISEKVATLRAQIEEVDGLLGQGRAAAGRGDCRSAIATYGKILSRFPGIREAARGRQDCQRMLPPTFAE